MPDNGLPALSRWGAVLGVTAAAAVVVAYLFDGPRLVWVVAAAEVLLVMAYVARRFRPTGRTGPYPSAHRPRVHAEHGVDAAHCERCRRVHEARYGRRAA